MEKTPCIDALEIERFFGDQATRVTSGAQGHERQSRLQKLMIKMQTLPDEEFAAAYKTLSNLIDSATRTANTEERPRKPSSNELGLSEPRSNVQKPQANSLP